MDMLHRDKLVLLLFLLLFFISCSDKKQENNTSKFQDTSSKTIGGESIYQSVFSNIMDTLNNWKANQLFGGSVSCNYSSFRVDSLICFNKGKNKLVTCILESGCNEDYGDGIHFLYGAKIKSEWFIYRGAYIFLPRENYQDDIHTPLSFEKLHEIAMKEVFNGYLIKNKNGEWEVNEDFFIQMESRNPNGRFGSCGYCQTFDEYVLYLTQMNWKKE